MSQQVEETDGKQSSMLCPQMCLIPAKAARAVCGQESGDMFRIMITCVKIQWIAVYSDIISKVIYCFI